MFSDFYVVKHFLSPFPGMFHDTLYLHRHAHTVYGHYDLTVYLVSSVQINTVCMAMVQWLCCGAVSVI